MNNTETMPGAAIDLEKQAWKDGASGLRGLNEANAAPLAPEAARSGLKKWLWRLSLLVAFALGWMLYSKYQADKAISTEITRPAVQVTPPAAASVVKKLHIPDARKMVLPSKKSENQAPQKTEAPEVKVPLISEKLAAPDKPVIYNNDLIEPSPPFPLY
jgi:hypothetical protein